MKRFVLNFLSLFFGSIQIFSPDIEGFHIFLESFRLHQSLIMEGALFLELKEVNFSEFEVQIVLLLFCFGQQQLNSLL